MLVEMVGWSLTWDPTRELPVRLLSDHLTRAAAARLAPDLAPSAATLMEDIVEVNKEIANAMEDIGRDLQLQVGAGPGR